MKFRIDLGNGVVLEDITMTGGMYVSEREISEDTFKGMKKVVVSTDDGLEKTMKRAKLESFSKVGNTWKFLLRELSKEERKEATRRRKIDTQNEWIKEKYDRVSVTLPKGTKEKIVASGSTVNAFINEAVRVMLEAQEGI